MPEPRALTYCAVADCGTFGDHVHLDAFQTAWASLSPAEQDRARDTARRERITLSAVLLAGCPRA